LGQGPQIQKLADRSDVISEVPNAPKSKFFGAGTPLGETALPRPLADGKGPRFYWSQSLIHYGVGNPTNDRFQM